MGTTDGSSKNPTPWVIRGKGLRGDLSAHQGCLEALPWDECGSLRWSEGSWTPDKLPALYLGDLSLKINSHGDIVFVRNSLTIGMEGFCTVPTKKGTLVPLVLSGNNGRSRTLVE